MVDALLAGIAPVLPAVAAALLLSVLVLLILLLRRTPSRLPSDIREGFAVA